LESRAHNSTKARETDPEHERQRRSRSRAAIQRTICWTGRGRRRFEEGGELFSSPSDLADQLPNPPLICSEGRGIAVEKPEQISFENRSGSVGVIDLDEGYQKIPC